MQPVEISEPALEKPPGHSVHHYVFWAAAGLVVVLDQATKALVRTLLERGESWPGGDWPVHIRYVTNTGAAFGTLQNQTAFLIGMTFIGLAAIYLYYRYPPFDHPVVPVAIGMMLGGAVGNLIDRVRLGRVTDFIDFPMWPQFNVADSSITVGIAIILIGYVFLTRAKHEPHEDRPADR
jgi:signal peptidase II